MVMLAYLLASAVVFVGMIAIGVVVGATADHCAHWSDYESEHARAVSVYERLYRQHVN